MKIDVRSGSQRLRVGATAGMGQGVEAIVNAQSSKEDILKANQDWWKYWEDYWKLRKTNEAYEKDPACELTIPIKDDKQFN